MCSLTRKTRFHSKLCCLRKREVFLIFKFSVDCLMIFCFLVLVIYMCASVFYFLWYELNNFCKWTLFISYQSCHCMAADNLCFTIVLCVFLLLLLSALNNVVCIIIVIGAVVGCCSNCCCYCYNCCMCYFVVSIDNDVCCFWFRFRVKFISQWI